MKIQVTIEATTIEEYVEAINALAAGYQVAPNPITAEVLADVKPAKAATNYAQAKEAVEIDTDGTLEAPKEQSYHRTAKQHYYELLELDEVKATSLFTALDVNGIDYLSKGKCTKFTATLKEAILKAQEAAKEDRSISKEEAEKLAEQIIETVEEVKESVVSFVDVKLKAKQLANLPDGKADVKFILDKLNVKKLSDLSDGQYAAFMELAAEVEDKPSSKEDKGAGTEPVQEDASKESEKTADKEVTLEMIRSLAKELSVEGFKDEIKGELKNIGAVSLTKIPKDKYAAFYERLRGINA